MVNNRREFTLLLSVIGLLLASVEPSAAQAIRQLTGLTANVLNRNDDGSTPTEVPLGFTANFFGKAFNGAFVNNNGNLTFGSRLSTFTPFDLTANTGVPIIASFFGDVDTRNYGSTVTFGVATINGHKTFGADFINVTYFGSTAGAATNSFQELLIDRSDIAPGDFDVEFNYDHIGWETGTASGGHSDGTGGNSARVGYSNGSGDQLTYFEIAGSGVPGSFLDDGPQALIKHSIGSTVPGRFIFPVRNGLLVAPPTITNFTITPNQVSSPGPNVSAIVETSDTFDQVKITCDPQYFGSAPATFYPVRSGNRWAFTIPTAFLKVAKVNPLPMIATAMRNDGTTAQATALLGVAAPLPSLSLGMSPSKTSVGPSFGVIFSGVLNNLSATIASRAILTVPLPTELEYVPGSATGVDYDPQTNSISFAGPLATPDSGGSSSQSFSFEVRVKSTISSGTEILLAATASCSGFSTTTIYRHLDVDQLTQPRGVYVIGDPNTGLLDGNVDVHPENGYPPLAATVSPIPMRPDIIVGQRRFATWLCVKRVVIDSNVTVKNGSSLTGGFLAVRSLISPSASPTYDATFLNVGDSLRIDVGTSTESSLANFVDDLFSAYSIPFTPSDVVAALDDWKLISAFTDVSNYMTVPPPKTKVELLKAVAKSVLRLTVGLTSADYLGIEKLLERRYGTTLTKGAVFQFVKKVFSVIKITEQFGDVLYLNHNAASSLLDPELTVKFIAFTNSNP